MKTIEYRVQYTGAAVRGFQYDSGVEYDVIRVTARDLNSGFAKALKVAREPLGSGRVREIGAIEFHQVVF